MMKRWALLLLVLLCSCAREDRMFERVRTDTFDAVAPTDFIPRDTVLEIEAGLVGFATDSFKANDPELHEWLRENDLLDLRRYKRQYMPWPEEGEDVGNARLVHITLILDDSELVGDGTWLRSPISVTDGWGDFLYIIYDTRKKEFVSAGTGGIA